MDEKYRRVSVQDFVDGKEVPFPIFVRLSKNKYVKVVDDSKDFTPERL